MTPVQPWRFDWRTIPLAIAIVAAFMALMAAYFWLSSDGGDARHSAAKSASVVKTSEGCRIGRPGPSRGPVILFANSGDIGPGYQALTSTQDPTERALIMLQLDAFFVDYGTPCAVQDVSLGGAYRVRVLRGPAAGKLGWLPDKRWTSAVTP